MTDIVERARGFVAGHSANPADSLILDMADEIERLRERLGPRGLEVVEINDVGHYVNEKVKAEIERLREVLRDIATMRAEELYYADGQEHDNAAAAYAAQALKPS